jgi:hypothetical protein
MNIGAVFPQVETMRGITHLCVHTVAMGLASPGEHVKVLEQFKKDVLG